MSLPAAEGRESRSDQPTQAHGFWRGLLGWVVNAISPLWQGWRLILFGDPSYPARYREWSEGQQISCRTDPDDPWIFWLGGYSASVAPFRKFIDELSTRERANMTVMSLAGHNGWFGDFARSRCWTWYREAEKRFLAFHAEAGRPVIVSGLSTGGLIAILLAWRHPSKVKGLVLDATALRIRKPLSIVSLWMVFLFYYGAVLSPLWTWLITGAFQWWTLLFLPLAFLTWGITIESSLVPPEVELDAEERKTLYWDWLPLIATSTLPLLQLCTWLVLPWVECPAFVAHGALDSVIPPDAGRTAWRRLGSREKWFRLFQRSSHPVLIGPEQGEFLKMAFHFARSVWVSTVPNSTGLTFDADWCTHQTLLEPDPAKGETAPAPPRRPPLDPPVPAPPFGSEPVSPPM